MSKSPQYSPFKISYNTHKDKWSINELLATCVDGLEMCYIKCVFLCAQVHVSPQVI